MNGPIEEVGPKACIVGKIVQSQMKWAGHIHSQNKRQQIIGKI